MPVSPRRFGPARSATAYGGSPAVLPVVTTLPASRIGTTQATLNGTANPEGLAGAAWIAWGPTPAYGSKTASVNIGALAQPLAFSGTVTGLTAGVTYHFAAVAQTSAGTVYGQDLTVTLGVGVPLVGLPQFDAPFRLDSDGRVVVVEQDSDEEIAAAAYNVLVCEQGAKLNDPDFGRTAPLFDQVPLDLSGLLNDVRRLEPRAAYTVQDIADLLDPSQRTIPVAVSPNISG